MVYLAGIRYVVVVVFLSGIRNEFWQIGVMGATTDLNVSGMIYRVGCVERRGSLSLNLNCFASAISNYADSAVCGPLKIPIFMLLNKIIENLRYAPGRIFGTRYADKLAHGINTVYI